MQAPPQKRDTKRLGNLRQSTWAAIFFAALFAFVLIAGFVLGREVFSDLERQRTASSDNVQWTLTQVEVEYLAYLNTLDHFAHAPAAERQTLVAEARKQFDIFFSRVDTLGASPLFADLRGSETYSRPLANVQAYLAGAIPLIDSDDLTGGTAAAELLAGADAVHDDIRALSLSGLSYFATLSDARRADTAKTLMRLTFIALMLLIMLISLAGYLYVVNRKVRQRGRALRQANARVQKVMATSLDAVIVVNSDGHVLEFNPSAEAMFGRTRSEALGKSIGTLIVPDHLRDAHTAGMTRMKSGGPRHVVGHGRVQLEAMRASGEVFPVELALESAFNGTEEIVIGFVRDISKRVAAQTELIAARDTALAGPERTDAGDCGRSKRQCGVPRQCNPVAMDRCAAALGADRRAAAKTDFAQPCGQCDQVYRKWADLAGGGMLCRAGSGQTRIRVSRD